MIDIYFKCDWCNKTVEHKHVEKGNYIFNDDDITDKLYRIELSGEDNHVCEDCYNAIQNKAEHLKALSEVEGPYIKTNEICVKYNDIESNISHYQDSSTTVTCEDI